MFEIGSRPGHSTSTDIVAAAGICFGIALQAFAGHPTSTDVVARPSVYYQASTEEPADFPKQHQGLRVWDSAMVELCLVDETDAPTGMGGVLKFRKGGVTFAVYIVETTDPNATPVRIKTSAGVKAIRVKT